MSDKCWVVLDTGGLNHVHHLALDTIKQKCLISTTFFQKNQKKAHQDKCCYALQLLRQEIVHDNHHIQQYEHHILVAGTQKV